LLLQCLVTLAREPRGSLGFSVSRTQALLVMERTLARRLTDAHPEFRGYDVRVGLPMGEQGGDYILYRDAERAVVSCERSVSLRRL
jgi:hypothetical protein